MANDPHLPLRLPSTWYENHLKAGDYHATGVSFPGLPGDDPSAGYLPVATGLGDPPSIDDLLDALDSMDAQDQQDAADTELEIEQYLQEEFQMQLFEDIQLQDQIDIDLDFRSLIPELQGIVVLASKGPDRDVIVLAGE